MVSQSTFDIQNIEKFLRNNEKKDLLRFITCGSVDDGKSTLIGRLLHDSNMIFEDQLAAVKKDSIKLGTQGDNIDLALLVDGLQSEREQGITIDVAYRYFSTEKRKFIIADTPGHEQYTRNMATGASTADLAIILIDARYGVQSQTRRHSYIVSLLGIKKIIVAINKMDLVDFSKDRFDQICSDYKTILNCLPNYEDISFEYIPISALNGDNIVYPSNSMTWFNGHPLMEILDYTNLSSLYNSLSSDFRFPVQYVNRPHLDFRGFCGTIASGSIKIGDEVTILPSGKTTKIKSIIPPVKSDISIYATDKLVTIDIACTPMAVTLTMEDEIDISRGDIIVHSKYMPPLSNKINAMIVWMGEEPMTVSRNFLLKTSTTVISGYFEEIHYKVDINSYDKIQTDRFSLNDIGSCTLSINQLIAADTYLTNRLTGSFIIIDSITNNTIGAGMIMKLDQYKDDSISVKHREYSKEEITLNQYICDNFPEWGCISIV
jgi:sulfate adenylyltransferase subunit 1